MDRDFIQPLPTSPLADPFSVHRNDGSFVAADSGPGSDPNHSSRGLASGAGIRLRGARLGGKSDP